MNHQRWTMSPQVGRNLAAGAACGLLLIALGAATSWERATSGLLIAAYFLLTVSLGGLLLMALEYVTGAGWSVALRRVPEALAWLLWLAGLLMLGVVALRAESYAWSLGGDRAAGTFWFKQLWLQPSWLVARAGLYVFLWGCLALAMVGNSRRQDASRDAGLTQRNRRLAALTLVVFAPTFTLAACDWMMALEPMWFSTVWGVYHFAGLMMAALAVVILLCLYLRRAGPLQGIFHDDHLHDLGQLLIGFSCFWMYLWFSQYMLIWYAHIPEETSYFVPRMQGAWQPLILANLAINWVIPFLVLLPRASKRSGVTMARVATLVLVGRWLDLYLMVYPSTVGHVVAGPAELGAVLLAGSLLLLGFFWSVSRAPLVPLGDPLLEESLGRGSHPPPRAVAPRGVLTHGPLRT